MARPHHKDPFFACFNMDLSVIGGHFASVEELVTAATSPFCIVASVFDITAFDKLETIKSDIILAKKSLV